MYIYIHIYMHVFIYIYIYAIIYLVCDIVFCQVNLITSYRIKYDIIFMFHREQYWLQGTWPPARTGSSACEELSAASEDVART